MKNNVNSILGKTPAFVTEQFKVGEYLVCDKCSSASKKSDYHGYHVFNGEWTGVKCLVCGEKNGLREMTKDEVNRVNQHGGEFKPYAG